MDALTDFVLEQEQSVLPALAGRAAHKEAHSEAQLWRECE